MSIILVVDDEESILDSMSYALDKIGHEIIQAKDGLEALHIYADKASEISLVIMDVLMPIMDGIASAKAIKEINPSARIILISGSTKYLSSDVRIDAFIPKPFSHRDLCATVRQVISDVCV